MCRCIDWGSEGWICLRPFGRKYPSFLYRILCSCCSELPADGINCCLDLESTLLENQIEAVGAPGGSSLSACRWAEKTGSLGEGPWSWLRWTVRWQVEKGRTFQVVGSPWAGTETGVTGKRVKEQRQSELSQGAYHSFRTARLETLDPSLSVPTPSCLPWLHTLGPPAASLGTDTFDQEDQLRLGVVSNCPGTGAWEPICAGKCWEAEWVWPFTCEEM